MEIRDIIYSVGLTATLVISIVSLIMNLRNRRNGMREHLYKEQMAYFIALSKELHILSETFSKVELNRVLSDSDDKEIGLAFDAIDMLTETHDIITPEEISKSLNKVTRYGYEVNLNAVKGNLSIEEVKLFYEAIYDLSEDMREHLGIDRLSDENRKLSFGQLKLSETRL